MSRGLGDVYKRQDEAGIGGLIGRPLPAGVDARRPEGPVDPKKRRETNEDDEDETYGELGLVSSMNPWGRCVPISCGSR